MKKYSVQKMIALLLLSVLFAASVCACGKHDPSHDAGSAGGPFPVEGSGSPAANSSERIGIFLDEEDLPRKDNSLDAYSAALNSPFRVETPENELPGGILQYFLDDSHAVQFQRHYLTETDERVRCIPMLHLVNDRGESSTLDLSSSDCGKNAYAACAVPGTGHYLILNIESFEKNGEDHYRYHFFETDESLNTLRSFYADFFSADTFESPYEMSVDNSGNIHLLSSNDTDDGQIYYIASSDGSLLYSCHDLTGFAIKLFPLYDGRIALRKDQELLCFNPTDGTPDKLAEIRFPANYVTLLDEHTLLYADTKGLYSRKLSEETSTPLYIWSNHGVAASDIPVIRVGAEARVDLIYRDRNGANYLSLRPTTAQVELKSIILAEPSYRRESYEAVATEFNRKYPAYHIELVDYNYRDSALLTQLIAGKGPVLFDSFLTGFEENIEYWEPLDKVYDRMGLENELIENAIDVGRVDGTLYGITDSFGLETVISVDNSIRDWDYDTFLRYLEDNPSAEIPFGHSNGCHGTILFSQFFIHSLEDNYLFDAENRTTRFGSDEFRRILDIGKKCDGRLVDYHALLDGTTPCYAVSIEGPECVGLFRNTLSSEVNYIGYPSKNGSRHYIRPYSVLTVRASATDEEKMIAHTFLKSLLSYEAQLRASRDLNFGMSVRRDVLEQQINSVQSYTTATVSGYGWMMFGADEIDNEADSAVLWELIKKAVPYPTLPNELSEILFDELEQYFEAGADADRIIDNLENRVGLYLKEQ